MQRLFFLFFCICLVPSLGCSESSTEPVSTGPQATTPTDGSEPELLEEGP